MGWIGFCSSVQKTWISKTLLYIDIRKNEINSICSPTKLYVANFWKLAWLLLTYRVNWRKSLHILSLNFPEFICLVFFIFTFCIHASTYLDTFLYVSYLSLLKKRLKNFVFLKNLCNWMNGSIYYRIWKIVVKSMDHVLKYYRKVWQQTYVIFFFWNHSQTFFLEYFIIFSMIIIF